MHLLGGEDASATGFMRGKRGRSWRSLSGSSEGYSVVFRERAWKGELTEGVVIQPEPNSILAWKASRLYDHPAGVEIRSSASNRLSTSSTALFFASMLPYRRTSSNTRCQDSSQVNKGLTCSILSCGFCTMPPGTE